MKTFWMAVTLLACATSNLMATDSVISLRGNWRFRLDPQDVGRKENWPATPLPDQIQLPGTTDLAGFGEPAPDPNPGYLAREHKYIGAAWYQRDIDISAAWQDREIELFLERVLWESRVWVDGRDCGAQDSLGTPHIHNLGKLAAGKHTLTIRIDNRMIHPIGDKGHCYTEHTQTIWNGVVGRIELRAHSLVWIKDAQAFPNVENKSVMVKVKIGNATGRAQRAALMINWRGPSVKVADRDGGSEWLGANSVSAGNVVVDEHGGEDEATLKLQGNPQTWDEFEPVLQKLTVTLSGDHADDVRKVTFGFRTLGRDGQRLLINGRPSFMRGNLDCAQYPRTGHPPMDVESWRRVFRIYQEYGLNQVRFHSWCPPEAAYQAADELGIYLQPEVLWIDHWMSGPNPRKDMDTPGYPKGVGKGDRTIDQYVRAEMRRMFDTYGNHPSFCFFAIGNELGNSDFAVMADWLKQEKERDPRRLYAASTARTITPQDDFSDTHNIPGIGGVVNSLGVPHTDWDYEKSYSRAPVPIIAHEMGQMPVYPDWREIAKHTGPVRARNFELFREQAQQNGIAAQSAEFQQASGAMNRIIYKNEMEAQLRSPGSSGVSWLSLQDFPGQGEALVGWLDTFYDSKGFITPAQFRRYSAPTVPLARFKKFVWTTAETFVATAQVAHWGAQPLANAQARWTLRDAHQQTLAQGDFQPVNLAVGNVTTLGEIRCDLVSVTAPQKLNLEIQLPGTSFANDWDLWVFPASANESVPTPGILVTADPAEAFAALAKGERVLLLAHQLGNKASPRYAAWMPLFWSARFFPGQNRETLGAVIQAQHPALALFPTDGHLDWQWREICDGAHGFVLDDLPADYRPIVQPVSDYHFNHKLGTIFEFRTPQGGKLLVCGYDIAGNLGQRPAARHLRTSLLRYVASPSFTPKHEVTTDYLAKLFPVVREAQSAAPTGFENAVLYVRAGAKHPANGDVPWQPAIDDVKIAEPGFGYRVQCNAVWKDATGTAWWGSPTLRVELTVPKPNLYDCYVHFHDWNNNGRTGQIVFEGREFALGAHTGPGKWVKLEVLREDCLDGKLVLEATRESGPNLQITAIALVPRQ